MQITVRYFAAAREAASLETEEVDLPGDATVADLEADLARRHPGLARLALRFAVGTRFAGREDALSEGDAVALIPPVSGG